MAKILSFNSFEKIKTHFLALSKRVKNVARDTARALTLHAEKLAKERVQSTTRKPNMGKGNYFRSIKSEFLDGPFTGKLESNSPLAGIIEFGSRPHIIRGHKLLFWPGAKHPVKEAKHPGTPAFRVLGSAIEEAAKDSEKVFESVLKKNFN
jgi:hypothetical protein